MMIDLETFVDDMIAPYSIHRKKYERPHGTVARRQLRNRMLKRLTYFVSYRERRAEIATIKLILNTCKYEGRELYLSTTAVEMLLSDLQLNLDARKAITALDKQKVLVEKESENA